MLLIRRRGIYRQAATNDGTHRRLPPSVIVPGKCSRATRFDELLPLRLEIEPLVNDCAMRCLPLVGLPHVCQFTAVGHQKRDDTAGGADLGRWLAQWGANGG